MGRRAESYGQAKALGSGAEHSVDALLRIARMALGYRWRMLTAVAAVIVAAIFQLLIPQFLGAAVDNAQGLLAGARGSKAEAQAALLTAAALLLGTAVLRGLFTMVHNYQGEAIGHGIGYELRLAYYAKLQQLSFSFHDSIHTGDLITRGMLDIEGVRWFVDAGILRLILLVILISVGSYLLVSTDFALAAVSLSFVPFVAWRAVVARLRLRRLWLRLQERLGELTRVMEENLGGIRVVRAFAAQDYEIAKFNDMSDQAFAVARERVGVRMRNTTVMTFAYFVAMGLVLWVGGLKVIAGDITVGQLAEFLAFMAILQMPVRQLGMMVNSIARASISGGRLFEFLDLEPEIRNKPDAKELRLTDGVLQFEDIGFTFGGAYGEGKVLSGISFSARPGHTVGIVGPPGSGKSTIAHLIPRYYDATSGRITIDGQDIRDLTIESVRQAVGVVQQDTFLFTASIENNVAYGDPWADGDRIEGAAVGAQLHDHVRRLPTGYETLVGERGVSLSGGQRQRLSIARSVMLKPAIMVFDDSTAAIDAATEQRIRASIREVTKEQAVIIISHRLSSLMHANEILFLENGRIVERGSHDQLIAQGGKYRDLYELQIKPGEDHGVMSDLSDQTNDSGV
jgi:ATP-binding cassette subfamily B protein